MINNNAQTTPISPLNMVHAQNSIHTKSRLDQNRGGNAKTSKQHYNISRKHSGNVGNVRGDISGNIGLNQDLDTTPGNFSLQ